MKKILLTALFAFLALAVKAQTPEDFHFFVQDQGICWRQVYESPADSTAVLDLIFGSGNFSDIAEISRGISFTVTPRKIDIRAGGFKAGSVAVYVVLHPMTAHGLLEMKDGRYRVTVDRIVFESPLEDYALNRRMEFKPVFVSMNAAKAIDSELTRLFTIREAQKEDW